MLITISKKQILTVEIYKIASATNSEFPYTCTLDPEIIDKLKNKKEQIIRKKTIYACTCQGRGDVSKVQFPPFHLPFCQVFNLLYRDV